MGRRIAPDITDAGLALKVAAGSYFYVQLASVWLELVQDQVALTLVQKVIPCGRNVPSFKEATIQL
jgi:hypothetical protein